MVDIFPPLRVLFFFSFKSITVFYRLLNRYCIRDQRQCYPQYSETKTRFRIVCDYLCKSFLNYNYHFFNFPQAKRAIDNAQYEPVGVFKSISRNKYWTKYTYGNPAGWILFCVTLRKKKKNYCSTNDLIIQIMTIEPRMGLLHDVRRIKRGGVQPTR